MQARYSELELSRMEQPSALPLSRMTDSRFPDIRVLDSLFVPTSIALVGASPKPNTYGRALFDMCTAAELDCPIYLVNRSHSAIDNHTVYPDLKDIPESPELVVISVANNRVLEVARSAITCGARALLIFAEMPNREDRQQLQYLVADAGVLLCGPNTMGLHNLVSGMRLTPFPAPANLSAGGVGLISQSGSIMGALVHNDKRIRFSHVVGTGTETSITAAEYLYWMVHQPETKCVGLFLETIRNPALFIHAMEAASKQNIPVVIMKVGRSAIGAKMAFTHTGALVGNDGIFRTLVKRLGGHLADTVDELAAQLMLFSQGRSAVQGGVASIHDSGGETALLGDLMEERGLVFASLSENTKREIAEVVEPEVTVKNPLDAWATGVDAEKVYTNSMKAMMSDPAVAVGLYVLDWRQDYYLHAMHARCLIEVAKSTRKPIAALSNYSLTDNVNLAGELANHNIPLLEGTREGLLAVRQLLDHRTISPFRKHPRDSALARKWRERLSNRLWIGESEAYQLLQDYDISCASHGEVETLEQAQALFDRLKAPVVVKTTKEGVAHKSDVGGVRVGLESIEALTDAYLEMSSRLGNGILIAKLETGSEWSLGVIVDPDFGPAIRIAPGGVMVELMNEQALLMAPFDENEARVAIELLSASKLLKGYRSQPEYNVAALSQAASNLSRLAWELSDCLSEIEINPILVQEDGAIAVDALMKPFAK